MDRDAGPQPLGKPELARRIRAAMAYGNIQRDAASKLLGVKPRQLSRYTSETSKYRPDSELLWQLADKAKLPREWFSADLTRLHEIVPYGMPKFVTAEEAAEQAAKRFADAARWEAERQRERSETEREDPPGGNAGGEGS